MPPGSRGQSSAANAAAAALASDPKGATVSRQPPQLTPPAARPRSAPATPATHVHLPLVVCVRSVLGIIVIRHHHLAVHLHKIKVDCRTHKGRRPAGSGGSTSAGEQRWQAPCPMRQHSASNGARAVFGAGASGRGRLTVVHL